MPTFVRTDQCDGCRDRDEAACVYICPHDLMRLDSDGTETGHPMRAVNQEPDQCWECYACVKLCPRNAIGVRHYADIVPLRASVQPLRGPDAIAWTITFRDGSLKRFEFPIRTTAEDSIEPYAGKPAADLARIAGNGFFVDSKGFRPGDPDELIAK